LVFVVIRLYSFLIADEVIAAIDPRKVEIFQRYAHHIVSQLCSSIIICYPQERVLKPSSTH
jgi:hypothetical protein